MSHRQAHRLLLWAARDVLERPPTARVAPIDTSLDVPMLLHLAAAHHVGCAVLKALLREPESARAAAARSGITLEDLTARRLAIVGRTLSVISESRRALALLDAHGIRAVMAPEPGVAWFTSGVEPFELAHTRLLVAPDALGNARDVVGRDASLSGAVAIDASVACPPDVLFDLEAAIGRSREVTVLGQTLRVFDRDDQHVAVHARVAVTGPRLDDLVALAALAGTPLDENAAQAALRARETPAPSRAVTFPRRPAHRRELWVAGFPSPYGGADTELDHFIDLLRGRDVDLHLVPMFGSDADTRQSVLDRGGHIHDYRDDVFKDKVVVSFCNGEFLAALPSIVAAGRPRRVIWFNCMTWLFDREKEAHAHGWIDVFGFQSQYQRDMLMPLLERIGPVHSFHYRPYFDARRIEWRYREWGDTYRLGRISRDDGAKFSSDTWTIFDRVRTPSGLRKAVYVLGYGPNTSAKLGNPPDQLECQLWAPNSVPAAEFYRTIDTMVHKTGGSRESSSRVLFEAYAYGVVPIVERAFAFPEMIVHGETGLMASTSDEMSHYATELAHNPREHRRLAENGRRHLEDVLASPEACWASWPGVLGFE